LEPGRNSGWRNPELKHTDLTQQLNGKLDKQKETTLPVTLSVQTVRVIEGFTKCPVLPRLESILSQLRDFPLILDADTKPNDVRNEPWPGYFTQLGTKIGQLVRKNQVEAQVVTTGFSGKTIEAYLAAVKRPGGVAWAGPTSWTGLSGFALGLLNRKALGRSSAHLLNLDNIRYTQIDDEHNDGKAVGAYTMYDDTRAEGDVTNKLETVSNLVRHGVDWIETDNVPRLQEALTGMKCKRA
jgi:hypothetical protein